MLPKNFQKTRLYYLNENSQNGHILFARILRMKCVRLVDTHL